MKLAFERCAEAYAAHRPAYPAAVLGALAEDFGPASGRVVADVGAGTGIATRQLAERGYRVIAVEPGMAMLQENRRATTERPPTGPVDFVCAPAERTGLAGGSVDLVAAFQAFHWFNPPYALAEFGRILKPGGGLALCWNNRDADRSVFLRRYDELIRQYNPAYRREYRQQDWSAKVAATGLFLPTVERAFAFVWTLDAESFVGSTRSVSYIHNVLSTEAKPMFEHDLRALIERHFADGVCRIPMRTRLWTARRIG